MVKNSGPEEISPMAFEKHVLNGWGISVGNFFNDMFEKKYIVYALLQIYRSTLTVHF